MTPGLEYHSTQLCFSMVIDNILEVNDNKYFIHQVDKWSHKVTLVQYENASNDIPVTKSVQAATEQNGDCIYINHVYYAIDHFDEKKNEIYTTTDIIIKLGLSEPSYQLFMDVIGYMWDTMYKDYWKKTFDRAAFVPCYYETIEKFRLKEYVVYNGYRYNE